MTNHPPFALDRRNAKWLGVCAGLGRTTGVNVTLIRVAVVVASLCTLVTVGVVAYVIAALAAEDLSA